jgi:hypothetical protein
MPTKESDIKFSDEIVVNTDSRQGGCIQEFKLSGNQTVALDVAFWADDEGTGQCTPYNAIPDRPLTVVNGGTFTRLVVAPDQRYGGCLQQLKLRKR